MGLSSKFKEVNTMFLKGANIDREELLQSVVEDFVYAKSRYSNTLLGEPKEITRAESVLFGVCLALGLNYEIVEKTIIFKTNKANKTVLELPFNPSEPW